jgi:hypothetical protein
MSGKLLPHVGLKMSKESVNIIYDANNIKFEKANIYCDFTISLINLILNTYLGDELIKDNEIINHFKWCWTKNVENFKKEGIIIDSFKLYEHFLNYFLENFYISKNKLKDEYVNNLTLNLWLNIFDYDGDKNKSELDLFVQTYKLFENSTKK